MLTAIEGCVGSSSKPSAEKSPMTGQRMRTSVCVSVRPTTAAWVSVLSVSGASKGTRASRTPSIRASSALFVASHAAADGPPSAIRWRQCPERSDATRSVSRSVKRSSPLR